MNHLNKHSRVNKYEKRRKITKAITSLVIIGGCLVILLMALTFFSNKEDPVTKQEKNDNNELQIDGDTEENEITDISNNDKINEEEQSNLDSSDNDEVSNEESIIDDKADNTDKVEQIQSTDDDNVIEVYTGNWEPVGTVQEGPHVVNYNDGSQDRIEIDKAVVLATELNPDDMITWWVGNGGEQKVVATVSDSGENEIYRVYLSWIEHEGWQPTKVEKLKENDIEI